MPRLNAGQFQCDNKQIKSRWKAVTVARQTIPLFRNGLPELRKELWNMGERVLTTANGLMHHLIWLDFGFRWHGVAIVATAYPGTRDPITKINRYFTRGRESRKGKKTRVTRDGWCEYRKRLNWVGGTVRVPSIERERDKPSRHWWSNITRWLVGLRYPIDRRTSTGSLFDCQQWDRIRFETKGR